MEAKHSPKHYAALMSLFNSRDCYDMWLLTHSSSRSQLVSSTVTSPVQTSQPASSTVTSSIQTSQQLSSTAPSQNATSSTLTSQPSLSNSTNIPTTTTTPSPEPEETYSSLPALTFFATETFETTYPWCSGRPISELGDYHLDVGED